MRRSSLAWFLILLWIIYIGSSIWTSIIIYFTYGKKGTLIALSVTITLLGVGLFGFLLSGSIYDESCLVEGKTRKIHKEKKKLLRLQNKRNAMTLKLQNEKKAIVLKKESEQELLKLRTEIRQFKNDKMNYCSECGRKVN